MARDRDDRFASAGDLAAALQRLRQKPSTPAMADTLAVSSAAPTMRQGGAQARSLAPPSPDGPPDHARTHLSRDVEQARKRRSALLIGAVALVVAVVAVVALRSGPSRSDAKQEPVVATADLERPAPVPPPVLAPTATASAGPADAAVAQAAGDARAASTAKVSQPARESGKPKPSYSRAKEHGLGTEDPFAPK
jgi:hypothetical protein